ncbi:glycosyl hydrolase family 28-related protein [Neobacillus sp. SM06]|uniref:glycosyl hydrolase family 28-related protein n=1 Tax=Neobacillus sp. SM06 TaxID=3422492 RepID=UPI003D287ECB
MFDRNHNPDYNARLLFVLGHKRFQLNKEVIRTNRFFAAIQNEPTPKTAPIFPEWLKKLDMEYEKLLKKVKKEVNVKEFGAKGDGKTDDTQAFQKAIGGGRVKVIVPDGVYLTKGIQLPSYTILTGSGKRKTTLKLHDDAPKSTRLVTNSHYWLGNHHIYIEGLSLDWNVERLGTQPKTSTGGNHSSCVTFANVKFGWVKKVEAINPGLHGFDITSPYYDYRGDGKRGWGGSRYIWLDHLIGHGFGDDGITTHHSENILISYSHMCDPSGRAHAKGFSNSNGIEIDDGSKNVWLSNNSTAHCFGGVEVKAHENSSAAANVQIIGHLSIKDNRSFNFRHIGHHKKTDPESKTAYSIRATNLVAVAPQYTDLYKSSAPRAMVVSAYKNVVINQFTVIGDPAVDFKGHPVIAVQYRARNIVLNQVTVRNVCNAGAGIKVFGGDHHADDVSIRNLDCLQCGGKPVVIGQGVANVRTKNIQSRRC